MAPPVAWQTPSAGLAGGPVKRMEFDREASPRTRPIGYRPPAVADFGCGASGDFESVAPRRTT